VSIHETAKFVVGSAQPFDQRRFYPNGVQRQERASGSVYNGSAAIEKQNSKLDEIVFGAAFSQYASAILY